jgi:hypothetical protein
MPAEWSSSKLVEYLIAAGAKGRTKSDLKKKIPKAQQSRAISILGELRAAGAIRGPVKNRSEYYFAPQFAPTRAQTEELIEKLLVDAGLRLTTKSNLSDQTKGFLQIFFKDALAVLKSEAKIIELKAGRITYYVHRKALIEQLRVTDDFEAGLSEGPIQPSTSASLTLNDVRPVYERLKTAQGGISTVKIYDIMQGLGAAKEDLHRLLINEEKNGRVSLHRASTTKFPQEVVEAGVRLEGQHEPLVTIVLKDQS